MSTFQDYQFVPQVMKGLEHLGFKKPTPVQVKAIPIMSEGRDLIGCAETGSGKTGAFAIPFFSKLIEEPENTMLVLTPTRELAQQVAEFCRELSRFETSILVSTIVGGADIRKQKKSLQRNPRIVVGTPGRVTDHLKRGTLKLDKTKYLVLDEGDRMLDMGFAPQLDAILDYVPDERQSCLFTATMAPKMKALAKKYLLNPEFIQVGTVSKPVTSIDQQVIEIDEKFKNDLILDELNHRQGSVVIFLKTKRRTNNLFKHLKSYGFKTELIHGDRSQSQRNSAIKKFRAGDSRILCATDVAARGLDIPEVRHVINFDLPVMKEDYVHRIGRTARNGADGEAVSFVAPQERHEWMELVKKYAIKGVDLEIPKTKARDQKKTRKSNGPQKKSKSSKPRFKGQLKRNADDFPGSSTDDRRPKKSFGKKKSKFKVKLKERSRDSDESDRPQRGFKKSAGKKKSRFKFTSKTKDSRGDSRSKKKTTKSSSRSGPGKFQGKKTKKKQSSQRFSSRPR